MTVHYECSQAHCSKKGGVRSKGYLHFSMENKGCWRDNVFVERPWRSIKYDGIYLRAYNTVCDAWAGSESTECTQPRTNSDHGGEFPDIMYFATSN